MNHAFHQEFQVKIGANKLDEMRHFLQKMLYAKACKRYNYCRLIMKLCFT